MLHVPYKGNAPVVSALLGREVDVALTTLGSIKPYVASGKLRILAIMEPKRFAGAPEIPTIAETLPQFRAPLSWFGFFGPAGVPQPIVAKLNAEIGQCAALSQNRRKNQKPRPQYLSDRHERDTPAHCRIDPDVRSAHHVNAHQGRGLKPSE